MALGGFVALGLADGVLGVAWPSIADAFGRDIGELGLLIAVGTGGYLLFSILSGHIERRIGMVRMLVLSSVLALVGLGGVAAASGWWMVLVAQFIGWSGGALIDAGLNTHIALHHSARAMHLLHAFYGVGATLGPILMATVLGLGAGWRTGYVVLAGCQVLLGAAFIRSGRRFEQPALQFDDESFVSPTRAPIALGIGVFLVYTGVEVGAGAWAFTVLTESRGLGDAVAGAVVAGYWGSLTVGRFAMGYAANRVQPLTSLIGGATGALLGLALFWSGVGPWAGGLGLFVAGLGLAPMFPALVLLTPDRVGTDRTSGAVGYQLAAAGAGAVIVPGGIGILVESVGLGAVAPALVAAAAVMAVGAAAVSGALLRLPGLRT